MMTEYAASYSRLETIVNAAQCIKDNLVCRICLELFKEPVTIKCGHKFCRFCILQVANNENAACPFCNVKIQKRSIPKESNQLLQSCVDKFNSLAEAILDDSGIDITQPYNKPKHTKESVTLHEKLNTSRFEVASVASTSSPSVINPLSLKSKVSSSGALKNKKLGLRKKQTSNESIKTPSSTKNTLHKYLSSRTDNEPDTFTVQSTEKVKSWLKNVSPTIGEATSINFDHDGVRSNFNDYEDDPVSEESPILLKTSHNASSQNTDSRAVKSKSDSSECSNQEIDEPKFKEVQMRVQEAEMMAKKKKLTPNIVENLLKTPCSIPATSHSDAGDWRRVKKVGKEMQVKTFKSLHVSVEKNSSSVALDDTVPYNINSNDSKNISKETESKSSFHDSATIKTKEKKTRTDSCESKENPQDVLRDSKHDSVNTTVLCKEGNISLSCLDKKYVNDIIGITSNKDQSYVSQKTIKTSSIGNQECISSSSKIRTDNDQEKNNFHNEQSKCKSASDSPTSPTKHRLSLKIKLNAPSTKPTCSQRTLNTPVQNVSQTPIPSSPERPKSRLSLRLPNKTSESPVKFITSPVKQVKTPVKQNKVPKKNQNDNSKSFQSSRQHIPFKKLGRICKKKKTIPFLYLGTTQPKKIHSTSNIPSYTALYLGTATPKEIDSISNVSSKIKIKSVKNVDYKLKKTKLNAVETETVHHEVVKTLPPEEDSQLKFLALNSPVKVSKQNKLTVSELNPHSEAMEIDKTLTSKIQLIKEKGKVENNEIIESSQASVNKNKSSQTKSTLNHCKTTVEVDVQDDVHEPDSNEVPKAMNVSDNIELSGKNKNLKPARQKSGEPEKDAISISSEESEEINVETLSSYVKPPNKHTSEKAVNINSEAESCADSDLIVYEPRRKNVEKEKSLSMSSSNASIKRSSLKKKRTHSESSNDDDDVTSIIGKWCDTVEDQPAVKKAKMITRAQVHQNFNPDDEKYLDDFVSGDNFINVDEDLPEPRVDHQPKRDPPIDDIINQVKAFKETEDSVSKVATMPSSMHSADLFDTNEHSVQPSAQRLEQLAEVDAGDSSAKSSPSKNSDKENFNESNAPDVTIVDKRQFQKSISNHSENSYGSDKENDLASNDLTKSQDPYHVRESLMNITQEQIDIKRVEKALIGIDLSVVQHDKEQENVTTPTRKNEPSQDDDFDTDNIDATPVAKKRQTFIFPLMKCKPESNETALSSPERRLNLIPAVTPVRNTRSYPLCHSTPLYPNSPKKEPDQARDIVLVCSSLSQEKMKTVQTFAIKFNARFNNNFTNDVTHVIVHTDPETKGGQKTSKYIQGIAFKKYVVSYQWVVDCLTQNTLLDENDEKYEVLDPETLEPGAKKSRERRRNLFDGFAFYCLEPFTSLPLNDFKNVLSFNGAEVATTLQDLSLYKNKFKIIILENEDLSQRQISTLKKSGGAMLSFEWVVDSISQYSVLTLIPYLYETSVDEALALGLPEEYLVAEENGEEEEDE